jgi:hypothetical protein
MQTPTLFAELLLPILLGPTRAPSPAVELHAAHSVEITIVERARGEKPTRTELELPANGKLQLWVASGDARRFCEVQTTLDDRSAELFVALRCRNGVTGPDDLSVEARPQARPGKPMLLAKLERADGRSLEVTAKLQ